MPESSSQFAQPERVQRLLEMAKWAIESGKLDRARGYLQQAARIDPWREDVWLLFARTASSADEARAYLTKALSINPASEGARGALVQMDGLRTPPRPKAPTPLTRDAKDDESNAPVVCSNCGSGQRLSANFCAACGAPLRQARLESIAGLLTSADGVSSAADRALPANDAVLAYTAPSFTAVQRTQLLAQVAALDDWATQRVALSLMTDLGYSARVTRKLGDGTVEMWAEGRDNLGDVRTLVHLRRTPQVTGLDAARQLASAAAAQRLPVRSALLSVGPMSPQARVLAQSTGIVLIEGDQLLTLMVKAGIIDDPETLSLARLSARPIMGTVNRVAATTHFKRAHRRTLFGGGSERIDRLRLLHVPVMHCAVDWETPSSRTSDEPELASGNLWIQMWGQPLIWAQDAVYETIAAVFNEPDEAKRGQLADRIATMNLGPTAAAQRDPVVRRLAHVEGPPKYWLPSWRKRLCLPAMDHPTFDVSAWHESPADDQQPDEVLAADITLTEIRELMCTYLDVQALTPIESVVLPLYECRYGGASGRFRTVVDYLR